MPLKPSHPPRNIGIRILVFMHAKSEKKGLSNTVQKAHSLVFKCTHEVCLKY